MANNPRANRQRGARWEIDLMKGLRSIGFDAERLRLAGKDDEGDVVVRHGGRYIVIEAKNAKLNPTDFLRQASVQALNFTKHRELDPTKVHPVVFVKRARTGFGQGLALLTIEEYMRLVDIASDSKSEGD